MLLATLLMVARLIAPAMAMPLPAADPVELALQTICHADGPGPPGAPAQPDHTDCLLCPACHLVAHAALPAPGPLLLPPSVMAVGVSAPLPPATGPPSRVRTPAQPTGPPALSA